MLEYVTEEQLIVVLSGKQRHVRLVPVRALDGDEVEWIKVAETKGCITLTTGMMCQSPSIYCLCVAIKKQVFNIVFFIKIKLSKQTQYFHNSFSVSECIASYYLRNNTYKDTS